MVHLENIIFLNPRKSSSSSVGRGYFLGDTQLTSNSSSSLQTDLQWSLSTIIVLNLHLQKYLGVLCLGFWFGVCSGFFGLGVLLVLVGLKFSFVCCFLCFAFKALNNFSYNIQNPGHIPCQEQSSEFCHTLKRGPYTEMKKQFKLQIFDFVSL